MIFGRTSGEDLLIESAAGAHRERDAAGRIRPSPAWADLPPAARETLFDRQVESRALEALADPAALDTTGRLILRRIAAIDQIGD